MLRLDIKICIIVSAMLTCIAGGRVYAADQINDDIDRLLDAPIKDLANMEVTSVSKRAEKASEAAAAIYVITQDDIRNSGFNSVPELLRMVPGVQVSRINSGWWAITARGNAQAFGNKLLVLIDGRSIYNPLFSGVLWEEQSTPLEDIERIEVIRGPGSTLYGANAVNGVINIITKNSKDTQGNLVSAGGGNYDNFSGLYRYGSKLGNKDTYRAYINNYEQGGSRIERGSKTYDAFDMTRAGIRYDSGIKSGNANYTISSDLYKGSRELPFVVEPAINGAGFIDNLQIHSLYGGNIIGKYNRNLDNGSDIQLQAYYDFAGRDADTFGNKIHTLDFDAQHNISLSERHQFMWGLGYRFVNADLSNSISVNYSDTSVSTNLFSGFVQDKIQLVQDELYLTLGSKLEHNDFTGFEIEPNARVTWLPTQTQTVWGAITRAVRQPSIAEETISQAVQGTPIGLVSFQGNKEVNSEKLVAYELGYRNQLRKDLSLDITTFLNNYDDLRTFESDGGAPLPTLIIKNRAYGITKGIEIGSIWQASKDWNLAASYSFLDMNIKLEPGSADAVGRADDGVSPHNMFNIRSHFKFDDQWEMDEALYYVGDIRGAGTDNHDVNAYIRFDARLGYKPAEGVELSLVGQNLFDDRHQEFGSAPYSTPAEIPRSVFGKVTFRF